MKMTKKRLLMLLLVLLLCAAAGVGYFLKLKMTEKADYLKYCDHAHRLHHEMVEFEKDYIVLPSEEAVEMDDELAGFDLTSSNGYLGQLVVGAGMTSEELFFLKGSSVCNGADNVVAPRKEILRPGENGWAYFKGRELAGDGALPLLVPGWNPKSGAWDDSIWKRGIPVLSVEGAVILYKASQDGEDGGYLTKKASVPFQIKAPELVQPAAK